MSHPVNPGSHPEPDEYPATGADYPAADSDYTATTGAGYPAAGTEYAAAGTGYTDAGYTETTGVHRDDRRPRLRGVRLHTDLVGRQLRRGQHLLGR
jgi:hypothetical protein